MSVTTFISVDIAAVPLLWVVPLAIYLLTFVVAFAERQFVSRRVVSAVFPAAVVLLVALVLAPPGRLLGPQPDGEREHERDEEDEVAPGPHQAAGERLVLQRRRPPGPLERRVVGVEDLRGREDREPQEGAVRHPQPQVAEPRGGLGLLGLRRGRLGRAGRCRSQARFSRGAEVLGGAAPGVRFGLRPPSSGKDR